MPFSSIIYAWHISSALKTKPTPYWNFTSGFDIGHASLAECIFLRPTNFIQIGPPLAEVWRHINFARWRPPRRKSTFGLRFSSHLKRSKTIRVPNFAKMSQSTAEILLLPVSRNKRSPSWKSTSTFHSDNFTIIGMWLCVGLPYFILMGRSIWRHIDFPRWRPRHRKSTSGFPFEDTSHLRLSLYEISPGYVNPRLRYY